MLSAIVIAGTAIVLLLGLILLRSAGGATKGMPKGDVIYRDKTESEEPGPPLYSARLNLTGRPDFIIRSLDGIIPVECKSGRSPRDGTPRDGHVAQLAAYCLLVREVMSEPVPYGVVRYADRSFSIAFTPEREAWVVAILERMRLRQTEPVVHRSHAQPWRCRSCGMRERCVEALR